MSISISFNEATADSIDCGELGKDACDAIKKQYSECKDNAGGDQEKKINVKRRQIKTSRMQKMLIHRLMKISPTLRT